MKENHLFQDEVDIIIDCKKHFQSCFNRIQKIKDKSGKYIKLDIDLPNKYYNIKSIQKRFHYLDILVNNLLNIKGTDSIPTSQVYLLNKQLNAFCESLESNLAKLDVQLNDYVFNEESFLAVNTTTEDKIGLDAILNEFNSHIDNCITTTSNILVSHKPEGNFLLNNILDNITSADVKSIEILGQLNNNLKSSAKILSTAQEANEEIIKLTEQSKDNDKRINELYNKTNEHFKAIEINKSEIETIISEAKTLHDTVTNFQVDFDAFDKELIKRNNEFKTLKNNLDKLENSLVEKNQDIETLINRSESLLAGATNAALASGFHKILDGIELKLRKARKHFYFSIFILFISSAPLALHILFSTFKPVDDTITQTSNYLLQLLSHNISISSLISYILLIAPGFWLTKFTAARHSALFRLHEDYAYKYSIAMGVEGYKKEAPSYKDEIAAATFFEIAFNPANNLDKDHCETKHPNPILDFIMDRMGVNKDGKPKINNKTNSPTE